MKKYIIISHIKSLVPFNSNSHGLSLGDSFKNFNNFFSLKDDELVGIHEGVGLMHPQDEYLFIMPAHLAYGITNENGAPLNATLIYKVKIVSVN